MRLYGWFADAQVRVQGAPGSDSWRCIAFNISTTGVGLTLPCPVRPGTVVDVHAWELPDACRLTARVVHVKQVEFLWFGGCELVRPLTEGELQAWMAGPIDWLPEAEPAAV